MKLERTLAGLPLEHPIMIAAGMAKTLEDVRRLANSAVSAIVVGSFTYEPRPGNDGTTLHLDPAGRFSLNSLGLPNGGLPYLTAHLLEMVATAHRAGKLLIVSVAGFNPDEYAALAKAAFSDGADMVELNLGCPNVWGADGSQKRIASFNPTIVDAVLWRVESAIEAMASAISRTSTPLAVKVSPFSDPFMLGEVARKIALRPSVRVLTAINTFPNGFASDERGRQAITPAGGLGGVAGAALKPIGLGQVVQWRALLPARIQIIGVGGISSGQDVVDYLRAGADAVQIATAYLHERERVFTRILEELIPFV